MPSSPRNAFIITDKALGFLTVLGIILAAALAGSKVSMSMSDGLTIESAATTNIQQP